MLHLANAIDVVDEGGQRVHLLKAEGERPAWIVGKTFGRVQHKGPVGGFARDVELELNGSDRRLAGAGKVFDLAEEHRARVEIFPDIDHHNDLRVPAVADGNWNQGAAQEVALVVRIAGLPQPPGFLHAIAERVHDEDRRRHHQSAFDDAEQVGAADALAARNTVHVEQEGVDPLHRGVCGEKVIRLIDGEPCVAHGATPFAASPKRRNSVIEAGFVFAPHSGCHCTPRQNAASSGPRAASTRPSSA